jgi:cell division protein FtsI/penicillin-binding protein 2
MRHSKQALTRTSYWSAFLLILIHTLYWSALVIYLSKLQVTKAEHFQVQTNKLNTFHEIRPNRGNIYVQDKDGNLYLVATTRKTYDIYYNPKLASNLASELEQINRVLPIEPDKIKPNNSQAIIIAKEVSPEIKERLKALKLDSIFFEEKNIRVYPENNFLARLLGFAAIDETGNLVGKYGIEKEYDNLLSGEAGYKDLFGNIKTPVPGSDIILNIDYFVQKKAEEILSAGLKEFGAESGLIVVAQADGKVLAVAEKPDYDPNNFKTINDYQIFLTNLTKNYEPGSVLKSITFSSALEENLFQENTKYFDTGVVTIDGWTIYNFDKKGRGEVTLGEAFEQSLNTGAIYLQTLLGKVRFLSYFKKFRFDKKPEIDLPYLTEGNIKNLLPPQGRDVNFATASFGQGVSLSPAHLLMAFSVFARDGTMTNFLIVNRIVYPQGQIKYQKPIVIANVLKNQTVKNFQSLLKRVMEKGSGRFAKFYGYSSGGKTGSAFIPRQGEKGYSQDLINTFITIFPLDHKSNQPPFIVLTKIDRPIGLSQLTAVPLTKKIVGFLINYYNIKPDDPIELAKHSQNGIFTSSQPTPNVPASISTTSNISGDSSFSTR